MNILDAIILGIVEGLTEFLPVSSTGHLILAADFLGLAVTDFLTLFEVVIQLGAILAVVSLYWKKFLLDWGMNRKILLALVPSLIVGALFYPFIKSLFASSLTVVVTLFLGGVAILLIESWLAKKTKPESAASVDDISFVQAFLIGLCQALSVIPGVSRAGATIMGGLLLGLRRKAIVEFSFLLAVPTMIAASAKDLYENGAVLEAENAVLLITGFITAYGVAILAIKFFLRYIETNTFTPFGWYRILAAVLFYVLVIL